VPETSSASLTHPTEGTGLTAFRDVGRNRLRHLRDGRQVYPAMLAAIDAARREILLEMYWVGDDKVGHLFRDHLVAKAKEGVAVFVSYDSVGSLGLHRSFWTPLVEAGGRVVENGPIAPWRHRFVFMRLFFRDHRKILVVDGERSFCGGLNLAGQWLPRDEGGQGWRDDAVEIQGPASLELRAVACGSWRNLGSVEPKDVPPDAPELPLRTWVLANRVEGRPNRRISRSYLLAIRRARISIDVSSAYFLPGPLFLRALREARARGVRVRVLIPRTSDVWFVGLAMLGVVDKLLREKIEVYAYEPAMLHAKTAVLDGRVVVIGSHNLDTLSWRFNLEANVVAFDRALAADVSASFERDLRDATRLELAAMQGRPWTVRALAWVAARFRAFM
jgi:cardiolipin synthase A/B